MLKKKKNFRSPGYCGGIQSLLPGDSAVTCPKLGAVRAGSHLASLL